MSRKIHYLWVTLLVSLTCAGLVLAQVTTGTISGTVRDETGAVLPGVTINAVNTDTGIARTVISDDEGRYHAVNLAVGPYEIRAELTGFQSSLRSGVQLTIGREAVVDFALRVGEISETIEVTGEAPLVETTGAAISGLIEEKRILELPLNGRSFEQLATLELGVNWARGAGTGEEQGRANQISIAGARPSYSSWLMDGTAIANSAGATPGGRGGQFLGVETVKEFRVETSTYGAEFGGSAGGVINIVTKSGSNEFHGSLFEFHRNDNLDARNTFDLDPGNPTVRSDPPEFKRNQFGFSLGGPIIPNKTFFFAAYEGLRESEGQTKFAVVPLRDPSDPFTVIFTEDGTTQTAVPEVQPYLALWPFPTPGGIDFGDGTAERIVQATQTVDEDFFQARVDHNFSDRDSAFVRYTISDSETFRPDDLPEFSPFELGRNQFATVEWKRILTNNLFNTSRFGFNRTFTNARMQLAVDIPEVLDVVAGQPYLTGGNLQVRGGITSLSASSRGFPVIIALNHEDFSNDSNYIRGSHNFKFGVNIRWIQVNAHEGRRNSGEIRFRSLDRFLDNRGDRFRVLVPGGDRFRSWRHEYYGVYLQDNIKLNPRLTLNAGLRYEFMTMPDEKYGRCFNLDDLLDFPPREGCPLITDNPTTKNFAPRLGLAWDLTGDGKTSLRAGFGIFHGNLFPKEYQTPGQSQPPLANVISIRPGRGGFPSDLQLLLPGQPLLDRPGIDVPDLPGDFRPIQITQTPYSIQYSLSLQRELFTDGVVTLGYMGNQGVHMPRTVELNVSDSFQILPDGRLFFPNDDDRINPLLEEARTSLYDGTSSYHSLIFGVSKRFSQGFQFQSSYTLSKGLDDSSGITNSFEAQSAAIDASQPFFRDIDRGLSSFDIRHNFSFNFSADIPFGRTQRWGANSSGPVDAVLGGWKLNGIWTLASGSPLSMRIGFNHSLSLAGDGVDRPNLVPGFSNNPTEGVTAGCTSGDSVVEAGQKLGDRNLFFDPCAFVLQEEGFLGDLGRNTAIGDAYLNFDFSLSKQNTLTEDVALEFRAEVFNLLNQTSLGFPDSDIFDDDDGTLVGSLGIVRNTIADSRQIQFGLKLLF